MRIMQKALSAENFPWGLMLYTKMMGQLNRCQATNSRDFSFESILVAWFLERVPMFCLRVLLDAVRKTGPRSNKIKQMQKQKTQKTHNTRETQIYVVHPVWATSTREIARSFLYYYPANEGIQPTAKPVVTSSSFSHSLLSQNTIFTLIHSRNTFPS
jgi:hypothetical protein